MRSNFDPVGQNGEARLTGQSDRKSRHPPRQELILEIIKSFSFFFGLGIAAIRSAAES